MTVDRAPGRVLGNPWVGTVFRVVLAGVLLYAGGVKLLEPDGARLAVAAFRIFPADSSWPAIVGWALPTGEVVIGLLLLVGLFVRWAALLTGLLMLAFTAGIVSVWVRGYSIDCGCFGGGGTVADDGKNLRYTLDVGRDLLFAAMAAWLVVWPRTRLALEGPGSTSADGAVEDFDDDLPTAGTAGPAVADDRADRDDLDQSPSPR